MIKHGLCFDKFIVIMTLIYLALFKTPKMLYNNNSTDLKGREGKKTKHTETSLVSVIQKRRLLITTGRCPTMHNGK